MRRIPIGLQLYSIRDDVVRDPVSTLKAVAAMGYEGVEFFGNNYFGFAPQDMRRLLDDLGLQCCGAHIPLNAFLGDALARTIEFAQALGNTFLIVPSLPQEHRNSLAAWRATARLFADLAAKLKAYGLRLGYHNHTVEFQPMEGELPFDVFFGNTSPDVIMQIDLGHTVHAGADPIAVLRKYPGRAVTIHVSEYSADGRALVGDRWPGWHELFSICKTMGGTEWYIVEQETYPYPPLESARRCLENLRRLGR